MSTILLILSGLALLFVVGVIAALALINAWATFLDKMEDRDEP